VALCPCLSAAPGVSRRHLIVTDGIGEIADDKTNDFDVANTLFDPLGLIRYTELLKMIARGAVTILGMVKSSGKTGLVQPRSRPRANFPAGRARRPAADVPDLAGCTGQALIWPSREGSALTLNASCFT
jgi:hypothetical protein